MANIENNDYIRVAVRVRPNHYENENELIVHVAGDRNLYLDRKEFTFDKVFNSETTQDEIFNFACPIIDGFIEGYNGTIFAYGQTGSGKTYTMFGKDDGISLSSDFHELENRGLIPRAVEYLFNQIKFNEQEKQMFNWTIKCSFVELYREKFNDLLDSHSTNLKLKMMGQDRYNVEGATEKEVQFPSDIFQAIMDGWNVRNVAETKMNQRSSRSHAIFMLELDTMEMMSDGIIKKRNSRLNLVDLAGSERQRDTGAEGERLNEAIDVNQSLSVLARVIRSISTPQRFISFRDSQLTQLLKDSLGGNARTMTIVNVHPNKKYFDNTTSSLDFANNLKNVKNKAKINEALSADKIETWMKKIQAQEMEIKRLNEKLAQKVDEKSAEKIAYYEEKIEQLEKHVAAFKKFANQKDNDLMVCKAKLKLKDSNQMEGLIIFGRAQEFLNRDDKNLTKSKEIFAIAKIRLKEKSILKLQSYIHARIAVDSFKKQRKLANEKLESRLAPKSLDRYAAKFPKPEKKEHSKYESSASACRSSLLLEVHQTFAFPRQSWSEYCSENFDHPSIVANNSDEFKRIFGEEFIESRRKSLDSMTVIEKTIYEDYETSEDNDQMLIAPSETQFPMYEDLSEMVLKFVHQIWPQVEKDERPFKVDLGTEKYEDFDRDSIEFVADFTCEFAEMAASSSRLLGPNKAQSKFFYQVPMNTPESMAKLIVERLCRKQDHSYKNLPRYKIIAHHELDTVEDLILEKLYQSENQWIDEIAKQLQKIKNSREEEEIFKGLEKIKWTKSD